MSNNLQKAADIVRKAVNNIFSSPLPEVMDENKFEMYIPNFRLDDDSAVNVRILVEPTRMLVLADLGAAVSLCKNALAEEMNRFNRELTHTRAVLYRGNINLEASFFLFVDEEDECERVEKAVVHCLQHIRFEGHSLIKANKPAVGAAANVGPLPEGGSVNFHLFDS